MAVAYSNNNNESNFSRSYVRRSSRHYYGNSYAQGGVANPNPEKLSDRFVFLNPPTWSEMATHPSGWISP